MSSIYLNYYLCNKYMNNKIFISIACYRDKEIIPTILDAYDKAKNKNNLVFGIFLQIAEEDEKEINMNKIPKNINVKLLKKSNLSARGPAYARYLINKHLWDDEKYYLQIDSHTRFIKDWDEIIKNMLSSLAPNSVISTYPRGYYRNKKLFISPTVNIMKFKKIRDGIPIFSSYRKKIDKPRRNFFWAAGFSFCYSCIFNIVPFDPYLKNLFWGEEFLMSLRFYTHNIKIYTPNQNIIFTLWDRSYRPTFWELNKEMGIKFEVFGIISMARLFYIANMIGIDEIKNIEDYVTKNIDKYNIGKRKTIENYFEKTEINKSLNNLDFKKIFYNHYFSLKN